MPGLKLRLPADRAHRAKLRRLIVRFQRRWGRIGRDGLSVEVSDRLRRSLGSFSRRTRTVRLSSALFQRGHATLLAEVVCHELAHALVHERFGGKRPHGREWRDLVARAGFEPLVRVSIKSPKSSSFHGRARQVWVHRCPVCQMSRRASLRVQRWRCAACVAAGLEGKLEILRFDGTAA
jgi:predicted SprT family Zn-dependent metalloprotease